VFGRHDAANDGQLLGLVDGEIDGNELGLIDGKVLGLVDGEVDGDALGLIDKVGAKVVGSFVGSFNDEGAGEEDGAHPSTSIAKLSAARHVRTGNIIFLAIISLYLLATLLIHSKSSMLDENCLARYEKIYGHTTTRMNALPQTITNQSHVVLACICSVTV
jgi:hypothetical protein